MNHKGMWLDEYSFKNCFCFWKKILKNITTSSNKPFNQGAKRGLDKVLCGTETHSSHSDIREKELCPGTW
jgi:hypothetical protein